MIVTKRPFSAALTTLLLLIVVGGLSGGCGRPGASAASFNDAAANTEQTLRELLLGGGAGSGARREDAPLLVAGRYESVVVAADAEGFARVSQGAVTAEAVRDLQNRVVGALDRDLKRRGFSANGRAFAGAASARREPKTLLATLIPVTEQTGSPADRAAGRGKTLILIRLTITEPKAGATLVQRDYYSGRDVGRGAAR